LKQEPVHCWTTWDWQLRHIWGAADVAAYELHSEPHIAKQLATQSAAVPAAAGCPPTEARATSTTQMAAASPEAMVSIGPKAGELN
jgi:hypothetical protein